MNIKKIVAMVVLVMTIGCTCFAENVVIDDKKDLSVIFDTASLKMIQFNKDNIVRFIDVTAFKYGDDKFIDEIWVSPANHTYFVRKRTFTGTDETTIYEPTDERRWMYMEDDDIPTMTYKYIIDHGLLPEQ